MVVARVVHGQNIYPDFKYVWVKGLPIDRGEKYR
jgi:hypothetical protein